MSYSRMVLEQVKHKIDKELYEEYRAQRPGYQNILDDAQRLSEDMDLRKAAGEYSYMLNTTPGSRRGLIPVTSGKGKTTPSGTFYSMSPSSLATTGASEAIRRTLDPETKLSNIFSDTELKQLKPEERQGLSQSLGMAQTELSDLRDMPNLTPGDYQEIATRSAEASSESAKKIQDEIRAASSDPLIKSGEKSLSGVTRALNPLEGQRQEYESSLERVRAAAGNPAISDSDYYKIEDDHLKLSRRMGTSGGSALERIGDIGGAAGDVASAVAMGQIYNPTVARDEMATLASRRFGDRLRGMISSNQQAARDALINQAAVNPNDATRITRTAAQQDFDSFRDIATDVANRRSEHNRGRPAAARALGRAGVLPGVGRSGLGRGK